MPLKLGSNESASLNRPAWCNGDWNAYNHLHKQGRIFHKYNKRKKKMVTHVQDGIIIDYFKKSKGCI